MRLSSFALCKFCFSGMSVAEHSAGQLLPGLHTGGEPPVPHCSWWELRFYLRCCAGLGSNAAQQDPEQSFAHGRSAWIGGAQGRSSGCRWFVDSQLLAVLLLLHFPLALRGSTSCFTLCWQPL